MNTYFYAIGFLILSLFANIPLVSAHISPENCKGSGLGIALYAKPNKVHIGDTISYTVDVFNGIAGGPIACDATDIEASVTTPDGETHEISLTRTSLSHGESDSYPNVVTYVAQKGDMSGSVFRATAENTGKIHQNTVDSQGGSNQSLNVRLITSGGGGNNNPPEAPRNTNGPSGSRPRRVLPALVFVEPVVPSFPKTGLPPRGQSSMSFWSYVFNLVF